MAHRQFTDVQDRPTEFLELTSLTRDEFHQLVPPFEAAFQAHMAAWRFDGKPQTARRFRVDQHCPLPTQEDRRLFILAYVKTYSLQVVQGRLFGMGQSKANQWIHVLLPVLLAALRPLGDAPARSLAALAQRLRISGADAAAVVGGVSKVDMATLMPLIYITLFSSISTFETLPYSKSPQMKIATEPNSMPSPGVASGALPSDHRCYR
jgi:hypothetical protein